MENRIKNIFKHATLCTIVACIFFTTLLCMDNSDMTTLPEVAEQVLSLLVKRDCCSHHMLCALAVNKALDKLLLDTAPARKKTFIKQVEYFNPYVHVALWHKYGSAVGHKRWHKDYDGNPVWVLEGGYLRGNGLIPHNYERTNIILGPLDWAPPRFNEQGDFVYYGAKRDASSHTILEYQYPKNIPCYLLLEKDDFSERFIEMVPFIAFPNLLKLFLNNLEMHASGTFKFCNVEKIVIPNNYKECAQYKSYNDLPEFWREIIDKRYQQQKK